MFTKKFSTWWIPTLVISVFLNVFLLVRAQPAVTGVKVIGVIDGDTVVLEGKSRVRLRYVNAPETGLCGSKEAEDVLTKLVLGKTVRIEETIPDQYGRGMALVYEGDILINKEMVATGWVRYHHDTSAVTEEIKKADDTARAEKRGIYSVCQSKDTPDNPKCIIKGNIDDNSDRKNYYLPTCAQYKFTVVEKDMGENWFCTEKEAQSAGYTKAKTCK